MLSGCQVCDWGIPYHLCSTYRGLWGLVVVRVSWLSGRALPAQAKGVLSSTPGGCRPFSTFLYFCLITSKFINFQHKARCSGNGISNLPDNCFGKHENSCLEMWLGWIQKVYHVNHTRWSYCYPVDRLLCGSRDILQLAFRETTSGFDRVVSAIRRKTTALWNTSRQRLEIKGHSI